MQHTLLLYACRCHRFISWVRKLAIDSERLQCFVRIILLALPALQSVEAATMRDGPC